MAKSKEIDAYIKSAGSTSKEDGAMLKDLRKIIHSVSKYDETIAYGMPAMKHKTKIVCCFAMAKNHLGYYPYSGGVITKLKEDLKKFSTSAGTIQFPKDKKLPVGIIKKLLKARMKEIDAAVEGKRKKS